MAGDDYISLGELVEVRKAEMESMKPGLQTEIIYKGEKTGRIVYSPDTYQKNRRKK